MISAAAIVDFPASSSDSGNRLDTRSVTKTAPQENEAHQQWLEAAVAGDATAFRWIYERYFDSVARQIGRMIGTSSDLEDVVQEVFVQVFRSIENYRFESKFTTWLYRLTYNVTVSYLRKKPKTVELAAWRPLRDEASEWAKLEARDLVRVMFAALEQVPEEHREAFLLHEVEGYKLREISELTGDSINTIAARIRRTRERMQSILEQSIAEGQS